MARLALIAAGTALGSIGTGPAAAAAPITMSETLTAAPAVKRTCQERLLQAGDGVAVTRWRAPVQGPLSVRIAGPAASDWDLALFDPATGLRHDASATFGSREQAIAWVSAGEEIAIQACRRLGDDAEVRLSLELQPMGFPPPSERISMVSVPVASAAEVARLEEMGLDVTHDRSAQAVTVALYSDAERERLRAAGFPFTTLIPDLAAADLGDRLAELEYARRFRRSPLPSGRTAYRQYVDYGTELKKLAEENPELVRKVTLPLPSLENRPIEGIEIAEGVNRSDDGRPVFVAMALVHAREWPGGDMTMEFAIDLVRGFGAADPRIGAILKNVRVMILPVMNPDGFVVSRAGGTSPADEDSEATLALALADQSAYKRKNCRPTVSGSEALTCPFRTASGVDLNRNFGAYWGGAGSSTTTTAQNYRGAAPYSEPEAESFHRFSSGLHITEVITTHTFTSEGTWLRQPGFNLADDEVPRAVADEAGMRELGDAMRGATGYLSQLGWKLGNITGATEDWNYFAQGAFGYTPEARGENFHVNYQEAVIGEYEGEVVAARGSDPTPDDESADAVLPGDFRGKGFREALLLAAEQAGNARDHSVLEGGAPGGLTLRLRKAFQTKTFQPSFVVDDVLETTLTVPASGRYEWHVNPSTRPLAPEKEAWTMTCENAEGKILESQQVVVDRGQRLTVDLACTGGSGGGAGERQLPGGVDQRELLRTTRGAGRRLLISRRSLRLRRGGRARIRVRCRSQRRCAGTLQLRAKYRPKRGRRVRTRVIARRRLSVAGRRRAVLVVRLSRGGRRLVARVRRVRVLAVANLPAETRGDERDTTTASFRLAAARARRAKR